MQRIFLILVLVAAVILGASWYVHRSRLHALNSGDVFVREQPGDNAAPKPPPAPAASPVPPPSQPAPIGPSAVSTPASAKPSSPEPGASKPSAAASAPAADTIARNPPNGMLFTGSGKYQLYRQGDITWRLNTDTGWACVLLATDAQWRRPRVYQQGCRAFTDAAPLRGY